MNPDKTGTADAPSTTELPKASKGKDAEPEEVLTPAEAMRKRIEQRYERDRDTRLLAPVPPRFLSGVAVIAGFVLPGLGHVLLGRWVKGVAIGAILLGMFYFGDSLAWGCTFSEDAAVRHTISYYLQHMIGGPALVASAQAPSEDEYPPDAFTDSSRLEFGMLYTCVAALLNLLVVLDVFFLGKRVGLAKLGIRPVALRAPPD